MGTVSNFEHFSIRSFLDDSVYKLYVCLMDPTDWSREGTGHKVYLYVKTYLVLRTFPSHHLNEGVTGCFLSEESNNQL